MKRPVRLLVLCALLAAFGSAGAADSTVTSGISMCFSEPSMGIDGFIHDLPWRASCVFNQLFST